EIPFWSFRISTGSRRPDARRVSPPRAASSSRAGRSGMRRPYAQPVDLSTCPPVHLSTCPPGSSSPQVPGPPRTINGPPPTGGFTLKGRFAASLAFVALTAATAVSAQSTHAAAPKTTRLRYTVAPSGNEARYRVKEQLAGFDLPNDAIGVTKQV